MFSCASECCIDIGNCAICIVRTGVTTFYLCSELVVILVPNSAQFMEEKTGKLQAALAAEEKRFAENQRETIRLNKTSKQLVDNKYAGTDGAVFAVASIRFVPHADSPRCSSSGVLLPHSTFAQ